MPSFRPELGTHRYSQPFATDHDYLVTGNLQVQLKSFVPNIVTVFYLQL